MQSESTLLPARGNDTAEILINDHVKIKQLLSELVGASETTARQAVLEQLKGVFTIHNATEENLVYPALREIAGKKSEALKLYNETAEADTLVFALDTMLKEGDETDFQDTAEKLQAAVLEHIEDEEEKALPHLQRGAEPRQAQMLTNSVKEFRGAISFSSRTEGTTGS